ncbi:hypothetical protein K435DRAFT_803997 [Dendrothele bispora CBS 962.96]|uniref:Uncharacterized protein n=1 Tax=Dendrothele bispora (strain CBS 962.96) TaxID=1314807 RepID=A0A4S8LFJ9_DENBC|nr:hypothetical protein K435DRAFT_803997 [Dendrothele bispora CBS 962.96]
MSEQQPAQQPQQEPQQDPQQDLVPTSIPKFNVSAEAASQAQSDKARGYLFLPLGQSLIWPRRGIIRVLQATLRRQWLLLRESGCRGGTGVLWTGWTGIMISTAVPTSGWRGYGLSGGIWTVFEWRRPSRSKELGVLWREIGLPEKSKWNPRAVSVTRTCGEVRGGGWAWAWAGTCAGAWRGGLGKGSGRGLCRGLERGLGKGSGRGLGKGSGRDVSGDSAVEDQEGEGLLGLVFQAREGLVDCFGDGLVTVKVGVWDGLGATVEDVGDGFGALDKVEGNGFWAVDWNDEDG